MGRRKGDTPQKAALRQLMQGYLKDNDISVKNGTDVNAIMRDMMSVILEGALDEELNEELGYSRYDYRNKDTNNSRNGHSGKTMHTSYGDMEIAVPRDRNGEYEPRLIKKYQNTVTQDMEEKILSMYAKGMTTGDIESHMKELYDIDISDSTISRITDKILPIVKEWQERPLEEVYAVVYMDAIHYHVRSEGRIVKRAVYIALGVNMDGKKEVLGMYVGDNESAKFWLSAPIQRETKMFLGADNEETAKLTVPMYDFGDWASRMKAYRKKNHITQQELAQLMGVKHFTLRSWEQKQTKPPYHVWRLHKHLFDNSIKLT